MIEISRELAARFYHFGSHSIVDQRGEFLCPGNISIGNDVLLRDGYRISAAGQNDDDSPTIIIGDGVQFNHRFTGIATNRIELGQDVLIGPNVYITDEGYELGEIDIPVLAQRSAERHSVHIGQGSWVGANCVIAGQVTIGMGCVVGANSVVTDDIPDYCVAAGSPARVIKMYNPAAGRWDRIHSAEEANVKLHRRRSEPLLSICIPVSDQKKELERCLSSIFTQIGSSDLIEVCVLDNASTDETPAVIKYFAERYRNFRYTRRVCRLDGDSAVLQAMELAKGIFLKPHEVSISFQPGSLAPFLNVLHHNSPCSIVHLSVDSKKAGGIMESMQGISAFLHSTSSRASSLSSFVVRRRDWLLIEDRVRLLASSCNHVYWQYALLANNPRFCLAYSNMLVQEEPPMTDRIPVIDLIEGYRRGIRAFAGHGLEEEMIREDKKRTLFEFILPRYQKLAEEDRGQLPEIRRYMDLHYRNEDYYETALADNAL